MSLIELHQFFQNNKSATLAQLHATFKVEKDVLKDMLDLLIQKNKICCKPLKPACGESCLQCDTSTVTLYESMSQ
jgi:endonuclease III